MMERWAEHTTVMLRVTDPWDLCIVVGLAGELVGEVMIGIGRLLREVVLHWVV